MKTIAFKNPKPADANSVDRWVGEQKPGRSPVKMKRFTIDVPADLHRRIKTGCAREGVKMTDVLREILETRFPVKP